MVVRRAYRDPTRLSTASGHGFTLIELLVVVAIVSVTLAVLLTSLHWGRVLAKRVVCRSNLREIVLAWDLYLNDHDQRFYQGVNVNHDFGGWEGIGHYALSRPLNPYVSLPLEVADEERARIFRCPADGGHVFSRPVRERAYDYFGNSYQTNLLLIGPDQRGIPAGELTMLYLEINGRLRNLTRDVVSEPSLLVLVGDNNWVTQWEPTFPSGRPWHRRRDCYITGFLDGHVGFPRIEKGIFAASDYRVLPFRELDQLVPDSCE